MTIEPTVPPVVGRKFRMRGGRVAVVSGTKVYLSKWPFIGYVADGGDLIRETWDASGWHDNPERPYDLDLVEMLP